MVREAVDRAAVLARQGEPPDPGLLRAHIVESLLQAATRVDGLNEASRLAWAPQLTPLVLSDGEARDVEAAAVRDDLQGWELAQFLALLDGAPSPELRALVLKRVDEAVASEEPVFISSTCSCRRSARSIVPCSRSRTKREAKRKHCRACRPRTDGKSRSRPPRRCGAGRRRRTAGPRS